MLTSKSTLFLLCAILVNVSNAIELETSNRIIGGETVNITNSPYLISLRYKKNITTAFQHRCSGSIYSPKLILTAATCVNGLDIHHIHIIAGTSYRSKTDQHSYIYPIDKYIIHPEFNEWFYNNDVAIVQLGIELITTSPIIIKSIPLTNIFPKVGTIATIAGWGSTAETNQYPEDLQMAYVEIMSDIDCKHAYGEGRITEAMFCAAGENGADACTGDAGSPLVANDNTVIGLVSWGNGCGRKQYPGVYTNLIHLKNWIEQEALKI